VAKIFFFVTRYVDQNFVLVSIAFVGRFGFLKHVCKEKSADSCFIQEASFLFFFCSQPLKEGGRPSW